ncbi:hypothetical protein YPF_1835 [Yersinia pestis biovar Orientalis str. India 195]|nr:hypothetical protein YP516_2932 [Yersinia pestis Nepal516]EEO81858.1 hypothetical protein YPF_1835 [Yersinia pestis biovar Orientalis str. India 195]
MLASANAEAEIKPDRKQQATSSLFIILNTL